MLEKLVLQRLAARDYVPLDIHGLRHALKLKAHQSASLSETLQRLEKSRKISRTKRNRYTLALPPAAGGKSPSVPAKTGHGKHPPRHAGPGSLSGRIRMNRRGDAMFYPDDVTLALVTIPARATGTALHGDHVLVRPDAASGESRTGVIVRILEHARKQIVGTFLHDDGHEVVIPDDPRLGIEIQIRNGLRRHTPREGDKVLVDLDPWSNPERNPSGTVCEVLGPPDAPGVDMASILKHYHLPEDFPDAALREAHALGTSVTVRDHHERMDCRRHPVVTIDPDDAKDFDDAICLQELPQRRWKLWVHVADVSHYVRPGGALEREARKRGNSTYLVDRVIPMLPEELSNELCSLKPQVDRLTKCVEFTLTDEGAVIGTDFYPAIIHSQRRFTYQEAGALLRKPATQPLERMLHAANRLAQRIRQARFRHGSLDMDFPETKIRLDAQGRFLRAEPVKHDESHQLIEEFMLLANEAVADRLKNRQIPAIYRIHESPDPERLEEFRADLKAQGIACGDLTHRREVQKLFEKIKPHPSAAALRIGFLRCLKRARYSPQPLGHYGLAKANYTHFTSPIRRYADLVVHRSLFDKTPGRLQAAELNTIAAHISDMERNSADAEQDSKTVKLFGHLAAQLKSHTPATYPGVITDLRNFGFFVEVPDLTLSGLVPLSSLDDDFYTYDEHKRRVTGRRHHRVFKCGDAVEVRPLRVDYFKKQVDFRLAPFAR